MAGPLGGMVLWIIFLGTTTIWNFANGQERVEANMCTYEEEVEETVTGLCRDYMDMVVMQGLSFDMEENFPTPELQNKKMAIITGRAGADYYDMDCKYKRKRLEKVKRCCYGWSPPDICNKPICQNSCENGGTCSLPDKCTCKEGWSGYRCQDKMLDLSDKEMYCFANNKCYGEKAADFVGRKATVGECCSYEGAMSWGVYDTYMCNNCNEIADLDNVQLNSSAVLTYGTCLAFGKSYYRTFDGLEYMFEGGCKYTLAQGGKWSIQIQSFECESACDCFKKVSVSYQEHDLTIYKGELLIDGVTQLVTDTATVKYGITFMRRLDVWIMVNTAEFRLKIDTKSSVYVTVEKDIAEQEEIVGLCGIYNGDRTDDFRMKSNELTSNPATFGNSWNTEETYCPSAGTVQPCKNQEERVLAEAACDILRMNTFAKCRNYVDYSIWYQMCVDEYCKVDDNKKEELRCKVIGGYAHECAQHQITVSWRNAQLCAPECPAGLVYNECISPCQRSCSNLFADLSDECASKTECISGCECPTGLIMQDNQCVEIKDCKCSYQDSFYHPNETVKDGCNECTCVDGQWDCTEEKCSRTASITGANSHITTFDGYTFDLSPGPCTYTMTKVKDSNDDDRRGQLNIEISFASCAVTQNSYSLNCFHNLKLEFKSTTVELRRDEITVNAATIDKNSNKYYLYNSATLYIKMITSKFVMVKGFGFHILYDFKQTVYVTLDRIFVDQVTGLFGTYNDDMSDDLMMRSGIVTTSVPICASSYRSQCSDVGTTTDADIRCEPSMAIISLCKNLAESEAFKSCIATSSFNVGTFIKWCEDDLCVSSSQQQNDMFCEVTAAMSMECLMSNKNINLEWFKYSPWDTRCIDYNRCDAGEYTECNTICEGHCLDVQLGDKTCIEMCVPGCKCTDGTLFSSENNELTCVTIDKCPCYDPYANRNVAAGSVATHGCTNCTCTNADWDCENDDCDVDIECPKNQVYRKGISGCSLTCETLDNNPRCESEVTYDGCGCPENQYKTPDGTCVTKENCPCKDNLNQYHDSGATIEHSCKTYKCSNRQWVMVNARDCPAVCWVSGGPHIMTFDEVGYDFDGDCSYYMAKSLSPKNDVGFSIEIKRLDCGNIPIVCTRMVTIKIGPAKVSMARGKPIEVDGNKVEGRYYSFLIGQYQAHLSIELLWTVFAVPEYELSVMWDQGTRVYVFLGSSWKDRVDGLCGNYNKDSNDDKGAGPLSSGYARANSFRTSTNCAAIEPTPFIPCDGDLSHRAPWAKQQCGILKGDLFEACRAEVKVDAYYTQCLYDACSCNNGGDCECLCTAIANYAEACARKLISVEWRSPRMCPIMCEKGKVYTACMSPCHQTCKNIGDEPDIYCNVTQCVEGCKCPDGFIEHDDGCIPADECPCYHDSIPHEQGDTIEINCQACKCTKGNFVCKGDKCAHNCTNEFRCEDGRDCISKAYHCDSVMDCRDGSDEWGCVCKPGEFKCSNGLCINNSEKCDGMVDCFDQSDEVGCPHFCENPEINQFQCSNGNCIPMSFRCDGHYDCEDDELNCNYTGPCDHVAHFRCGLNGLCLPNTLKCDGHDDCGDGSDELDTCQTTTSSTTEISTTTTTTMTTSTTTTEIPTTTSPAATTTTVPPVTTRICANESSMTDTEVSDILSEIPVEITVEYSDGSDDDVLNTNLDDTPQLSELIKPGNTEKITFSVTLSKPIEDVSELLKTEPAAMFVVYSEPNTPTQSDVTVEIIVIDENNVTTIEPLEVTERPTDNGNTDERSWSVNDLSTVIGFVITIEPVGVSETTAYPSEPSERPTLQLDICTKPRTTTSTISTPGSTTGFTTSSIPTGMKVIS